MWGPENSARISRVDEASDRDHEGPGCAFSSFDRATGI